MLGSNFEGTEAIRLIRAATLSDNNSFAKPLRTRPGQLLGRSPILPSLSAESCKS